jgi:hypothetical protein
MNAIKGTVKAGRVEVQVPPEWPEGTEVEIHPLANLEPGGDEGPMTPEEIDRTLAAMEKVEPFDMSAEEATDLDTWERKVKDYTIANMDKGIEDVFR